MKTLSVKNPWAYLIVRGLKDIENRRWFTKHRGTILIHASKEIDHRYHSMNLMFTLDQWETFDQRTKVIMASGIFDQGAIVGQVDIVDCIPDSKSIWAEEDSYNWVLENPVLFQQPTPTRGALSLWEFDERLLRSK